MLKTVAVIAKSERKTFEVRPLVALIFRKRGLASEHLPYIFSR
jgi:hypothetical protein